MNRGDRVEATCDHVSQEDTLCSPTIEKHWTSQGSLKLSMVSQNIEVT